MAVVVKRALSKRHKLSADAAICVVALWGSQQHKIFLYRMARLQTSSTQKCCHADSLLIYVCRTHRTLLSFSVQKNVANELLVVALFDVQT